MVYPEILYQKRDVWMFDKENYEMMIGKMLERPLFTNGRKLESVQKSVKSTIPRLSGILIVNNYRIALFTPENDKVFVVKEGDKINTLVVEKIEKDKVTLTGVNESQEVHLQFDEKAPSLHMVVFQLPMPVLTK